MDFWSAVDMASDYGLRVVAIGEDQSYAELSPGTVVRQNPPPGTLMAEGGEIQVTLSKRAGTGPLFDLTPDDGRFGQEVGEEY
jgi:beta-lactam-binding protein with PASTA domain